MSVLPTDFAPAAEFLPALLDLLPVGVVGYAPITNPAGDAVDFAFSYLNPAAQRMLELPAQPATSFVQQFPGSRDDGWLAFHLDTFHRREPAHFERNFQTNGDDNLFRAEARRLGDQLLVVFSDTADQPRPAGAAALSHRPAPEPGSRAAVEAERATLQRTLEQAPVAVAIMAGPDHRITFANTEMALIWGRSPAALLGRPHFEALPDLAGLGFETIFADVYHTGQPYQLHELAVDVPRQGHGQPVRGYYNIVYQPLRDDRNGITGIVASATEVTGQVLARQQVQQLNDELEVRVAARTAETQAALREAQAQREQLREQQGLLRQILGQVPASVATLIGPEHRFAFFNEQYQALSAQRVEPGLTVAEVFPEVVEQGFIRLLDKVYATGEPFVGKDTPVQLLDPATGQPGQRYVDFVYQPLRDGHDQIQGILAFIIDTTDKVLARHQADTLQAEALAATERRVREHEELYQVFEQAPVVVAQLRGPKHFFFYCNPAFQGLFPARQLTGRLYAEAVPEMLDAGIMPVLDWVYSTGEAFYGTALPFVTTPPDGSAPQERYYDFSYHPYREQDQITGVSIFAYDVTDQVLARRQADTLRATALAAVQRRAQQRQELYQIFAQTPVAIVLLREPDHRIDYFNPAFETLFPPEEWAGGPMQGHRLDVVYPRIKMAGLVELLDRVFGTGETQVVIDMPLVDLQPGSPRYVTLSYQAYREEGRIVGVAAFAYDVTDQVLARQQVQALNQELADINQEMQATNRELHASNSLLTRTNADLDTFVYSASHDLKSPITNIEGLLLALRQQLPAEAQAAPLVPRLLEMMDGAVARFQETLGHLTDVTRLQHTLVDQAAEAVDVPAMVEAVRLDIQPELTAVGATLLVDLGGCRAVYFPPKNLRSVLYNLLSNAIKYHDPARPALVQLRAHTNPAGQLLLEVQDNGLGLTPAQQGELFRLFRRLHSHVPGSGVGLYMVKKMVDNAGGTLAVHSEPGVGSTFTVTLPTAYPAQP